MSSFWWAAVYRGGTAALCPTCYSFYYQVRNDGTTIVNRETNFSFAGFTTDVFITPGGFDVFAVGTFSGAGLTDSSGIARWNETIDFTPPLTLNFSRTQLLPGNLFKSRLTSSERTTYLIEYSDDFQTWTALMTNNAIQLDFTNAVSLPVKKTPSAPMTAEKKGKNPPAFAMRRARVDVMPEKFITAAIPRMNAIVMMGRANWRSVRP